ncbi:MAG: bifunctional metallophosphatase/5'-nucleotidase, partial [Thermoanaerobaculia bacterium]
MAGVLLIAGLVFSRLLPGRGNADRFTILQINDVYKVEGIERETIGGLARVRALRKEIEKEGQPVLLLHAGDFLYPSVMSKFLEARPMVRCLNLLDGDEEAFDERLVVTFGNHEFDHESRDVLAQRILESGFRWVTSNILLRDRVGGPGRPPSHSFKNVSEDLLLDLDGIRVGILGFTVAGSDRHWVDYRNDQRDSLVRETLKRLKDEGAEVIVALTHQDLPDDEALAAKFPEIDLIVGGHDHFFVQKRKGRTLITKADSDARSAVRIDVAVLQDGTVHATPDKIDLASGASEDPLLKAATQEAHDELKLFYKMEKKRDLTEPVTTTTNFLEGVEPAVRGRETALGNLLADSIRQTLNTRVAFVNGGSIRINDNIPAGGKITWEDLEGIFYYDNRLVSFDLTRDQLLEILRNSVSEVDRGSGRFLQVSCIRFSYRANHPPRYGIEPENVHLCPDGDPEAPLSEWPSLNTVTEPIAASTIEHFWQNGSKEGYTHFAQGAGGKSPPPKQKEQDRPDWRKTFEESLKGKVIQAKVEGRIQRVDD